METLGDIIMPISKKHIFNCIYCHYNTSKKSSFDNHLLSFKHKKVTYGYKMGQNYAQNKPDILDDFVCHCGKKYQHRQGLWRHKKTCLSVNNFTPLHNEDKNNTNNIKPSAFDKDELILMLIKENTEFKNMMMEQQNMVLKVLENGTMNHSHNTTHTNSHNKAFNLNFFLNETCKNAMNITDFVDSIKLQLSDFMDVGEVGYVQGISNIIVKKLKDLDETVRPIHCTDQKRETFYVKDENKWEKEEEDLKNIRKMIKKVVRKNEGLMLEYKKEFPDYDDPESKRSDQYSKFVIEALGGEGDNNNEKENKIIKHISKATTIKNKTNKDM
jgi:hypothetical protein